MLRKLQSAQRRQIRIVLLKRNKTDVEEVLRKRFRQFLPLRIGNGAKYLIVSAVIDDHAIVRDPVIMPIKIRPDIALRAHRLQNDCLCAHQRYIARVQDLTHQRAAHAEQRDRVALSGRKNL